MAKEYNKLVRDLIPEIIITRVLSDDEYKVELETKLGEEYHEVLGTENSTDRIEELADMLEVIMALAALEGKTLDDVVEVAEQKRLKRGGFQRKIYLERVED